MNTYKLLEATWSRFPRPFRSLVRNSRQLSRLKEALRLLVLGRHEFIYHEGYYATIDETAKKSSVAMSESIVEFLRPKAVLDIGCGTGALLEALQSRGVVVSGLEYSDEGLKVCRSRGLDVRKFDITADRLPDDLLGRDVVISFEVAEHLAKAFADGFIELLCSAGRVIVLSAATPGQGGTDHVNEQPHEYWIKKLAARGYSFEEGLSQQFRSHWKERNVASWYYQNVMIFRK